MSGAALSDATASSNVAAALAGAIGAPYVTSGKEIGARYRVDVAAKHEAEPGLLVRPASSAEVSAVLTLAAAHNVPVTVVGGQTGTSGGAMASRGGIALSLERMSRIEEIDVASMTMTVEAGCVLQTAQEAAEAQGAFLPLDLGARGSATIGGVIATNAGGNRVLRWGMTRDMVIGLEAVLADGTVVSSLTKMLKDNAGYHWKPLLVGSEGTLGIVTRAVLRLRPLPTTHQTALVAVDGFAGVVRLLRRLEVVLSGRLSSFELMWNDFYDHMTAAQRDSRPRPLAEGHDFYVLLEAMGGDDAVDGPQFERVLTEAIEDGTVADAVIAQSERERDAIWAVREDFAPGLRDFRPFTAYDVSMSLAKMEDFVHGTREAVQAAYPDARMLFYGHAGDGNLHILIHVGPEDGTADAVDALVYAQVQRVGGSISAEHGVGTSRAPYLALTRSAAELALMRRIKSALDPADILNPGKILC